MTWHNVQRKLFAFHCADRYDEPQESLISTAQKSFKQSLFVHFAIQVF